MTTSTTHACQYIGAHGYSPTCTHSALPGHSYCAEHLAVVYQAGTARARRKKDERVAATVWSVVDSFNEAVAELEAEGYDFGEERWDVKEEAEVD
jgi:hypothetical protein